MDPRQRFDRMPCLGLVWNEGEIIYFFVQVNNKVRYAVAERQLDVYWKVELVK